jgi:hypothetical protein
MKDHKTGKRRGATEDKAPRGHPPKFEKRPIPPLKCTKIRRFSPAEREAFAAFKAGKVKPLVRKTFPKEVVDERLGQMADHMISRVRKKDRDRISRERLIEQLRAMLVASPLREVTAGENSVDR